MATEFKYDSKSYRVVSVDPGVYIRTVGFNKDRSWTFCLSLREKEIAFSALLDRRGNAPGVVEYDWTIEMLPVRDLDVPTYKFANLQERREAADIALCAMQVMLTPGRPAPNETPVVAATLSPILRKLLATGLI
jgi:hypothetical protein